MSLSEYNLWIHLKNHKTNDKLCTSIGIWKRYRQKFSYHFTLKRSFYSLNLSLNGILLMSFFSIQIFLVWVFWKSISDNLFSWNSIWLFFIPLNSGAIEQKQFYSHHFHSNLKVTIISMKLWAIDLRMDGYHTLSKWEDLRVFKPSTNFYPGTCNHLTSWENQMYLSAHSEAA